LPNTDNNLIG